ncbi:hypothetical protein [Fuerstiella marisgermanici]|uniref:OstA-like protein n=1 Tax=Fuerstiella marisgermanici TaxID=1891926 RepID=A0A1P8WGF3_9PLAN|nr:hypothetical protein [Fuerstiella marisgermanici]APZ93123.1 hypothetical protein Fuma_02739 [Fuerstiella marisgermanici]
MSIYNSQRRFFLSAAVAVGFAGLYLLFRAATAPYLEVERERMEVVASPVEMESISADARDEATKYFPAHSWVAESGKHFRDAGRYLFCKDFELSDDRHSVVVRPVAILWRADKDDVPLTIVADKARLTSDTRFSVEGGGLGRITGGALSGNVQIRGPRGLEIKGGTFQLHEKPMHLSTGEQVSFRFDGHHGFATSGVDIYMNGTSTDIETLSDLSKIHLLGRVRCNLVLRGRRPSDATQELHINAARGFVFDVPMKTGTFSGRSITGGSSSSGTDAQKRPLVRTEEVWVKRIGPDGAVDELICPELMLKFRNEYDSHTGEAIADTLTLEHLQAWGPRVEIYSPERQLQILANDVRYSVDNRQIDIRNRNNDGGNKQKYVILQQGSTAKANAKSTKPTGTAKLVVPHLRMLHTHDGDVQRIECNGAGILRGTRVAANTTDKDGGKDGKVPDADDQPTEFGARWGESLTLQISPDQITQDLILKGGATVAEINRKVSLTAVTIAMKLFSDAKAPVVAIPIVAGSEAKKEKPTDQPFMQSLRPERLTATGNVVIKSPEGEGRLRQQMEMKFKDVTPSGEVQTVSATEVIQESAASKDKAPTADKFSFVSDSAAAVVRLDSSRKSRGIPPYTVWLNGEVEVVRKSGESKNDFTATGNQLRVESTTPHDRTLRLFGDPARVVRETGNMQGARIELDLDENDGHAEIPSSGSIRFVTSKGFDGSDLPEPTPIVIYWSDRATFKKRSADFLGKTRVVMSDGKTQDVELQCMGLTVHFSKDVSLGPEEDGAFAAVVSSTSNAKEEENPIERIECHNKVEVNVDDYEGGSVVGRHKALFADLKVNLQTGDFHALGWGYLQSVSPDKDGSLQGSSPAAARANTPSQTRDTAFVFLKAEFVGSISGNIDRREATLSDHVVALMSPVRRVDEQPNLEAIPTEELPERAGILRGDTITFGAIWGKGDRATSFSMDCRKNASLESRSLAASADVITYDHSKEQFIIRADGQNKVDVNHRTGRAGRFNRVSGSRFEYYRQTDHLEADKIGGLNLTQ